MRDDKDRGVGASMPAEIAEQLRIHRRRIDQLDEEIVRLLNERASCANEIGALKEQVGVDTYQPSREEAVLAHVRGVNPGPLAADAVTRVFERIIDESRSLERHTSRRTKGPGTKST